MGDQVTDTFSDSAPTANDDASWPFEEKSAHAEWLGTSERTLDSWRNKPDGLPFVLMGRKPLFKRAWTLEWLEIPTPAAQPDRTQCTAASRAPAQGSRLMLAPYPHQPAMPCSADSEQRAAWRCACCSWRDDRDPLGPAQPWPSPEEE